MRTPRAYSFLTIPCQNQASPDGSFVRGMVFAAGSKSRPPREGLKGPDDSSRTWPVCGSRCNAVDCFREARNRRGVFFFTIFFLLASPVPLDPPGTIRRRISQHGHRFGSRLMSTRRENAQAGGEWRPVPQESSIRGTLCLLRLSAPRMPAAASVSHDAAMAPADFRVCCSCSYAGG